MARTAPPHSSPAGVRVKTLRRPSSINEIIFPIPTTICGKRGGSPSRRSRTKPSSRAQNEITGGTAPTCNNLAMKEP